MIYNLIFTLEQNMNGEDFSPEVSGIRKWNK